MRLSREKGVTDDTGFVNATIRVRGVTEGPLYPSVGPVVSETRIPPYLIPPLANAISKTYPLLPPTPMPYEGVYIYPYVPHSVIPSHRSPKSRLI